MNLRNNRPSLPSHIVESEKGLEDLSNDDFFQPGNDVRVKLKNERCHSCSGRTQLEIGKFGSLKLTCTLCDWFQHACPLCAVTYKKQQTVTRHIGRQHGDTYFCPFCSVKLASSVGDKIGHIAIHFSSEIPNSTFSTSSQFENQQFSTKEFPDQNMQPTLNNQNSNINAIDNERIEREDRDEGTFDNVDEGGVDEGGEIEIPVHRREIEIDEEKDVEDEVCEDDTPAEIIEEVEGEDEVLRNKREYDHYSGLLREFRFFESSKENFSTVIEPVQSRKSGDCGIFYDKANLTLIKFARKVHLSGPQLQELIDDMGGAYKSPVDFFAAETLIGKVHETSKRDGINYQKLKCEKNHLVCFVPVEEGLKMLFSKDDFLREFHVEESHSSEDQPYIHYRQSQKFAKESKRVGEQHQSHYISILANRDSFPAYLTANLPLKGYYYSIGNLDYPECERHVVCFAQGLKCDSCLATIDKEFVKNINRLSLETFLVYHKIFGRYVRFRTELDAEIDDTPQVSENLMTKSHTGRLFCSQCGQHECHRIDPYSYIRCKRKKLVETEILYNECLNMMANHRSGDGTITKVHEIEDKSGRSFTTTIFDKRKGHNITVLKKPTSFFSLNPYTKKNLINPPGPFHSVIKGYVLHCKDGLNEVLTRNQKMKIRERWERLEFPKGTKKPKDVWGIGGSNFDAIISLMFGLPIACESIMPSRFSRAFVTNFDSLIALLTPGFSRNQLRTKRSSFKDTIFVIALYIDIDYPTTHQVFHVWDRSLSISSSDVNVANMGRIPQHSLPSPPSGPILVGNEEQEEYKEILSIGPARTWNEKKFEVMHRRFKKKMRKCFLRNPAVFLVKEYIADETLSILYPESKWIWFSTMVRYTLLLEEFFLSLDEKEKVMKFLRIFAWETNDVEFKGIKVLMVRTKKFRRSHKIVCGIDCGVIEKMIHVSWNGGFGFEFTSIVLILKIIGSDNMKIHEVENAKGKPIMDGNILKNIIV